MLTPESSSAAPSNDTSMTRHRRQSSSAPRRNSAAQSARTRCDRRRSPVMDRVPRWCLHAWADVRVSLREPRGDDRDDRDPDRDQDDHDDRACVHCVQSLPVDSRSLGSHEVPDGRSSGSPSAGTLTSRSRAEQRDEQQRERPAGVTWPTTALSHDDSSTLASRALRAFTSTSASSVPRQRARDQRDPERDDEADGQSFRRAQCTEFPLCPVWCPRTPEIDATCVRVTATGVANDDDFSSSLSPGARRNPFAAAAKYSMPGGSCTLRVRVHPALDALPRSGARLGVRVRSGHGRRRAARPPRRPPARGRPDRRAHRRRHLDRVGHPRLPRAEGRLDEEPGGREDRDARSTTSPTPRIRQQAWQNRLRSEIWQAQPNAGHRALAELEQQGERAHARHPERRRAAPAAGSSPENDHRDPRHRARGEVPAVRLARARWTRRSHRVRAGEDDPRASSAAGC